MSNQVDVKILHNTRRTAMAFGFDDDDQLVGVHSFRCGFPACGHVDILLRIIFDQLNRPSPRPEWAVGYQDKGLRSLSVGDVVVIGETAYAVDLDGWQLVTLTADQVWYDLGRVDEVH